MTLLDQLKEILASTYSLASQSHLAHWNVTGPRFPSLHRLFQKQYEALYEDADAIAEFIRSRNTENFVPGGLTPLSKLSAIREMGIGKLSEDDYLRGLIAGHNVIIQKCKMAVAESLKQNDQDTANFLTDQSTKRKKERWMLVSSLSATP